MFHVRSGSPPTAGSECAGRALPHRCVSDFEGMSGAQAAALLAAAIELHASRRENPSAGPLRGKNVALLCEALDEPGAQLFHRAASSLGAQVAHLRPSRAVFDTPEQVEHTARTLGRLYDLVECIGVPTEVIRRIGGLADIPVLESISASDHPSARLAAGIDGAADADAARCAVIQAVLLGVLA